MSDAAHWESIYERKQVHQVSWFRPHLDQSLASVDELQLPKDARLIDVGAGASTFVDDLLDRGFTSLTVADLSSKALEASKRRLGARAAQVDWRVGDVTTLALPAHAYDFWHDRAVFHFLRDPADRARYVAQVERALKPGGHVLIATFGPRAPSAAATSTPCATRATSCARSSAAGSRSSTSASSCTPRRRASSRSSCTASAASPPDAPQRPPRGMVSIGARRDSLGISRRESSIRSAKVAFESWSVGSMKKHDPS
jgi:SAM-dependent methyltransferase